MSRNRYSQKENYSLWNSYHSMKKRCLNPNCKRYKDYGGRGIKVCDEWLMGFDYFAEWAYNNGYAEGLTIERKDVDGNYCPENCCWITLKQQARNKRETVKVTYRGEEKPLIQWCEELNLHYDTMHDRITVKKWSVEKAFETKSQKETSFALKCRKHNINPATARDRIVKFGWSEKEALNTPTIGRGANRKTYSRVTA